MAGNRNIIRVSACVCVCVFVCMSVCLCLCLCEKTVKKIIFITQLFESEPDLQLPGHFLPAPNIMIWGTEIGVGFGLLFKRFRRFSLQKDGLETIF
jgi:hypothetical protein